MGRERFKRMPGFPGYMIGDLGTVLSFKCLQMRRLIQIPDRDDYREVYLRRDGVTHHCKIHRMVLLAFVGPCPEGHESLHKNNVKHDNRLENLRWGTKKENMRQRHADGLCGIASHHHEARRCA